VTARGYQKPDDALLMTKREIAALLWTAHMKADPKAYLMFALQFLLGLRVGEVILLRYEHLGPRDGAWPEYVMIPTLKKRYTGGVRDSATNLPLFPVPVLSHPGLVLAGFNPEYRKGREKKSQWLFPGRHPKDHMTISWAIKLFHIYCDHAQLRRQEFTPHSLRHTAATYLHEKAKRDLVVSIFLRHSVSYRPGDGAAVTKRYIHVTEEQWKSYRATKTSPGPFDLPPLGPLPRVIAPAAYGGTL